jgi:hypothetical protein
MQIIEQSTETKNEELRRELTAISNRRGGLNPSTLLAVAKNPKSVLHCYFTWDDTEAARRWREAQAYDLIRRVKVTVTTTENRPLTIRAFFPVKQIEKDGTIDAGKRGNYMPVTMIANDHAALQQVIDAAIAELRAFQSKYDSLKSAGIFAEVFGAIKIAVHE